MVTLLAKVVNQINTLTGKVEVLEQQRDALLGVVSKKMDKVTMKHDGTEGAEAKGD